MDLHAFLDPVKLQDTPRLFTAIAEWLAVFVYFNIYKRRRHDKVYVFQCIGTLAIQIIYQFIAGLLPIEFWIPSMIGAVVLMYLSLYYVLDIKPKDCGVITTHAFVLAEFAASLYIQLYVWCVYFSNVDDVAESFVVMLIVYTITFIAYYNFEKENIRPNKNLNVRTNELVSVIITGIGAFIMSNLSFVTQKTPFSATENMLYVRTLVDFGGMLMLMTEMFRLPVQILESLRLTLQAVLMQFQKGRQLLLLQRQMAQKGHAQLLSRSRRLKKYPFMNLIKSLI